MGSKNDGFPTDHIKSKCCKGIVRINPTANGYSMTAWCSICGNYVFNGRTEALIALWMGDKEAVIKNKGYIPKWCEIKIFEIKEKKS